MYRIELAPGEVTVFRTIEELATGVRNGLISPKARIYHNASGKWLPIEFHPHYKAALALLAGRPTDVPVATPKAAETPSFENLSFLKPAHEKPAESASHRAFFEADSVDEPTVEERPTRAVVVEVPAREPLSLPSVSPSPVLELPKISYPEFAPVDPPVADSISAVRPGRRWSSVAAALVVLATGGYVASLGLSPAQRDAAPSGPSGPPSSVASPTPRPRPAAPRVDAPLPPASSGFAPALEPRAIVSPPLRPAKASATDSLPTAAPSIDMDVAVPALAGADSLTGTQRRDGDSAIKKILRAVSGGKDLPGQP